LTFRYKILYTHGSLDTLIKERIVALKFYDSPFHAIEDSEAASKSVLKADLTIMIRDVIELQGWTQKEAAEILGVNQPRVSDIVNGKIDKFTLDALFSILDKLGFTTKFTFVEPGEASIKIEKTSLAA
jgi:predicted XRE-type DNA-binding protein